MVTTRPITDKKPKEKKYKDAGNHELKFRIAGDHEKIILRCELCQKEFILTKKEVEMLG